MKTNFSLLAVALGFALVVAACDSGVTAVESTQPDSARNAVASKVPKSLKGGSKCPCFKEKDLEAIWWELYYDNLETWGSLEIGATGNNQLSIGAMVSYYPDVWQWSCAFQTEEGMVHQFGISQDEAAECIALIEKRAYSQVPPPVCCLL